MIELSIIIPAYNEEHRIRKTLYDYGDFFSKKFKERFEILVVLNGCTDNTLGIVKEARKKRKQIKYLDIKERIGKGGAVIQGFKLAKGALVGFVDADNSTSAKAYYDLVLNIDGYDAIIASRWVKGSVISKKQPIFRRVGSRGFNILVRVLFGIGVYDSQCGAKLFKKGVVKKIINKVGITQWAFDIDLLYQVKRNKFHILESPTVWIDHENSKFSLRKNVLQMFLSVVRLRLMYSPFKFIVEAYNLLFGE